MRACVVTAAFVVSFLASCGGRVEPVQLDAGLDAETDSRSCEPVDSELAGLDEYAGLCCVCQDPRVSCEGTWLTGMRCPMCCT